MVPAWCSRIRATVSNCGCIRYRLCCTHDTEVQAEFGVPGFTAAIDVEDVLLAANQCRVLLMAAESDRWSRDARDVEAWLASAQGHHIRVQHSPGGHDFDIEVRRRAYSRLSSPTVLQAEGETFIAVHAHVEEFHHQPPALALVGQRGRTLTWRQ